ncbi:hypothetical protein [Spirosoma utsteinense]|uniref:Uncharacterized protein n=1 Tax=Spirosoma utsteinense TaxID=2585773 RepID=A0ABR6WEV8_9BACT|nr:hypothetical protein [Spirosoma utsteinense]MBC3788436.1 hypothetical protein [Spirosoma utsteinense]MBC3794472.1 hypothetical protein [Spirosoma utsteinense]
MATYPTNLSKERGPFYQWLPLSYLLLFGGAFLGSLWAEMKRRQQPAKGQIICSCIGANPLSTPATRCILFRSSPKTNWFRDTKNLFTGHVILYR